MRVSTKVVCVLSILMMAGILFLAMFGPSFSDERHVAQAILVYGGFILCWVLLLLRVKAAWFLLVIGLSLVVVRTALVTCEIDDYDHFFLLWRAIPTFIMFGIPGVILLFDPPWKWQRGSDQSSERNES